MSPRSVSPERHPEHPPEHHAMAQDDKRVSININLNFPLDDGRTLVKGPLSYEADGLYTINACDFLKDPRFVEAYRLGVNTGHRFRDKPEDLHIEWRVHTILWAASHARKLPGDFVECGVNTGIYSRAIMHHLSFEKMPQRLFYLLDTYNGIPEQQLTAEEKTIGLQVLNRRYFDCHELVKQTFAPYPNARIIKGMIPDTLAQVPSEQVCYLSIDMNATVPEIAALNYFWSRLVRGAVVVLDDYGFPNHFNQKRAFDDWARANDVDILSMPTGQGVILKP